MPASAGGAPRSSWESHRAAQPARGGYLFNHKALGKVLAATVRAAPADVGFTLPACLPERWVVDCKAVGDGQAGRLRCASWAATCTGGLSRSVTSCAAKTAWSPFATAMPKVARAPPATCPGRTLCGCFCNTSGPKALCGPETLAFCTTTAVVPCACCRCFTCGHRLRRRQRQLHAGRSGVALEWGDGDCAPAP